MPKATSATVTEVRDFGPVVERTAYLDGYTVNFMTMHEASDLAPILAQLPTGLCQCPHWGVMATGRLIATYADGHEEVYEAGDTFYMPPGHTPRVEAGTEFTMFSPTDLLAETDAAVKRAMESVTH